MNETTDWGRLASLLLEAAGDRVAALGHPIWVQVLDPPHKHGDDLERRFGVAFSDATDGLMGQVVAPDCQAVGVIGSGRLRPAPATPGGRSVDPAHAADPTHAADPAQAAEPAHPLDPAESAESIRMVCLVTREGRVTWRMARSDGTRPQLLTTDLPPSEGRLLDCLRRCFGLPTSPPPASPARLQLIVWLVAALERAEGSRRSLGWGEVSSLHPVARLLASGREAPAFQIPGATDALTRMGAAAYSWEEIRLLVSRREGSLDDLMDPDLARWMDDGMFARWVLADLPSVDELFAALRPRLTASAARRLAHAVHASSNSAAADVT